MLSILVQIFESGATGRRDFHTPYGDEFAAQQFIFWPWVFHLNSNFGDLRCIEKLRIIFIKLAYHLSHSMIVYDPNLMWFIAHDPSWCWSHLNASQSCLIASFCFNYHVNCMIPIIINKKIAVSRSRDKNTSKMTNYPKSWQICEINRSKKCMKLRPII
jgi:hypothetical protein